MFWDFDEEGMYDEEYVEKFIAKVIRAIQKDYWKFLKEDVEITINKLLK